MTALEKTEAVEKELERCGYFCIVTSDNMSAQDAYLLYYGRDASEKLFRADKTFLGSKTARVHSARSVKAKMLVEFIALIILFGWVLVSAALYILAATHLLPA